MRKNGDFFIPALPKTELDPDDCPTCSGAGGYYVPSGCFGQEARQCETCYGKGKLSKKELRLARSFVAIGCSHLNTEEYQKLRDKCEEYTKTEARLGAILNES